jgi:phage gp36-like protein
MAAVLVTGSDLLARKDERVIADLVSDSGSPVAGQAVLHHPRVITALEDAEGEVVGTLQALGRYTIESLQAIDGTAASFLKRIICEIAMINLITRRPDLKVEDLERHEKIREAWLERLQQGNLILATEDMDNSAARADVDGATLSEFHNLNLMRDRSRYFPTRVLPRGRNY